MGNLPVVIHWNNSTSYSNLKSLRLLKSQLPETVRPLISFCTGRSDTIPGKLKLWKKLRLNSIRNRPRFKFSTKLSPVEYEQHLLEMIRANPLIHGKINREVASIWVNNNIDNYWKPYLAIRIEKAVKRKTILR